MSAESGDMTMLRDDRVVAVDHVPVSLDAVVDAGELAIRASKDPNKEGTGEDVAAALRAGPHAWVMVVADGVGGLPGGREAAVLSVQALAEALGEEDSEPDVLRARIIDGIEAANRAVLALGGGAATTLALAEVGPQYVRSYHVGDSGVLLVGQRGRVKHRTVPHSPVGFAVEAGLLDADEAMYHEQLHLISNVVGTADMRIEVGSALPLAPRDTLLLASDGLLDNVFGWEIVETIRCGPLRQAADRLMAMAESRMQPVYDSPLPSKPDDCSLVLFRPHSRRSRRFLEIEA